MNVTHEMALVLRTLHEIGPMTAREMAAHIYDDESRANDAKHILEGWVGVGQAKRRRVMRGGSAVYGYWTVVRCRARY